MGYTWIRPAGERTRLAVLDTTRLVQYGMGITRISGYFPTPYAKIRNGEPQHGATE